MGFTIGVEHPVSAVVRLTQQQDPLVVGSAAGMQAAEAARAAVEAALSAAVAAPPPCGRYERSSRPLAEHSERWSSGGYLGFRRRSQTYGWSWRNWSMPKAYGIAGQHNSEGGSASAS